MTRLSTDKCLLCEVNAATATNSHIFPKFLSTGFLKAPGKSIRGYSLDTTTGLDRPKIIQDSPKENHILCDDCEDYFGVIEGECRDTFVEWRQKIVTGDFKRTVIDDIEIVDCTSTNPNIIHLFLYSIFWRASISADEHFVHFQLEKQLEERLRIELLSYKARTKTDFLKKIALQSVSDFIPYAIITADSFTDPSDNINYAHDIPEPYILIVDKFALFLSADFNSLMDEKLKNLFLELGVNSRSESKFIVLQEDLFHKLIVTNLGKEYVKTLIARKKNHS